MSVHNYTLQRPGGFIDNLVLRKRLEMFQLFLDEFPESSFNSVLDVGVTADKKAVSANFFEENISQKSKIIALSDQDAKFLEQVYPGLKFKSGDARQLPFDDESIDVVFSSAVIEHVGSIENQKKMIAECYRVAKKGIYLTTPNRWYPVEPHTSIPLIHWLPKGIYRTILKWLGLRFYALEENLNLLDQSVISGLCKELGIHDFRIKRVTTFGLVSNLILIIKK